MKKEKRIRAYAFLVRGEIQGCDCHIANRRMLMIFEKKADALHLGYVHVGKAAPEIKEVEILIKSPRKNKRKGRKSK